VDPLQPIEGNAQLSKGLPDWDAYGKHHPSQSCPNATPHHSVLVDSVSCTLHPQRVQEQKNQPLWQLLTPEQIGSGETWSLHLLKTTPWFCLTISLGQRLQLFKPWYQLGKRLTGFGRCYVIKGCTLLDKFKLLITVTGSTHRSPVKHLPICMHTGTGETEKHTFTTLGTWHPIGATNLAPFPQSQGPRDK
jgi:hypothetical protein